MNANEASTGKRVIACNYREATKFCAKGSLCYVQAWSMEGTQGDGSRVIVLVHSYSGRWVEKWEAVKHLENFRLKTLPAEHPRYQKVDPPKSEDAEAFLERLRQT